MLFLFRIWAGSPTDVWVAGDNGDFSKRVWHYDGNSWHTAGQWLLSPFSIFGFSERNIYAGGYSISHYSGSSWEEVYVPKKDSFAYKGILFTDIRGLKEDNIWAAGFGCKDVSTSYGVIYHYNGKEWLQKMTMKKENIDFYKICPTGEGNKCLIYGIKHYYEYYTDSTVVFEYDGDKTLKEVSTGSFFGPETQSMLQTIQGKLLVLMNGIVYEYDKGLYREFISEKEINNGLIRAGRSRSDMFIWQPTELQHFNGRDTRPIFKLNNPIYVNDVVVFDKEIFFCAQDNVTGDYYLVKGKLKE
jgi:hypothetical protein